MYARESLAWIPSHELDSNQHLAAEEMRVLPGI